MNQNRQNKSFKYCNDQLIQGETECEIMLERGGFAHKKR